MLRIRNVQNRIIAGIEFELIRKRIKNMHLRIYPPDGAVRVSAPLRMSESSIARFVELKASWILKQQMRIQARPIQPELCYLSGEEHAFLGESYVLNVVATDGRSGVSFAANRTLQVQTKDPHNVESVSRLLRSAYRKELESRLNALVPKWEERMGVKSKRIRIRLMKRKWGACRPHSGDIVFNLELMKYPEIAIEYVVLHELAHLIEPSHNARFKGILTCHMPNWQEVEGILNQRRLNRSPELFVNL